MSAVVVGRLTECQPAPRERPGMREGWTDVDDRTDLARRASGSPTLDEGTRPERSSQRRYPSGRGAFTYNLRFPGQLYDGVVGLHYNYFRDYDASTGSYIESDPIGLHGGINTYLYANASPLNFVDEDGRSPDAAARAGWLLGRVAGVALERALIATTGTTLGGLIYEMCNDSDREGCLAEIEACMKTCQRARRDFDQPGVYGRSSWRCMTGCVPFKCQDYLDPDKHGDPDKK